MNAISVNRSIQAPNARPASAQAPASARRPCPSARDGREQRTGDPGRAPADHLPGRPRALTEEDVRGQRSERADHEPGSGTEHVARQQRDVGRCLHVRHRGEHDPRRHRQRGQRGDQRHQLRRRTATLVPPSPASAEPPPARGSRVCQSQSPPPREPGRPPRRVRRGRAARPVRAAPPLPRAPAPARPRSRSSGHPQGPPWSSRRPPRGRRRAARSDRPARAANSTSCVATITAAPCVRQRPDALGQLAACAAGPSRASARRAPPRPAGRPPPIPRPASTIASASRCRSPPERSRGSASARCSSPELGERRAAPRPAAARRATRSCRK